MSCFLAVAYADRVEILTDGAWYEPDGTLIKFAEKVWRSPFLPMAITARGDMQAADLVARTIIAAGATVGFDDTIKAIETMLAARRAGGSQTANHYELLIAGISETAGPVQFTFSTLAYGGAEALTLTSLPVMWAGPSLTPAEVATLGLAPGAGDAGLTGWGEDFIELARRHTAAAPAFPGRPEHFGIGGHLDLTVIRADGATTTRLRTWSEDQVGEKIDPFMRENAAAA
jgi:hypothetical protein